MHVQVQLYPFSSFTRNRESSEDMQVRDVRPVYIVPSGYEAGTIARSRTQECGVSKSMCSLTENIRVVVNESKRIG